MPAVPWKPGQSGNPSGRPSGFKGVARKILAETDGGAELVEYALAIWRDSTESSMRRDAMHQWLADRGLGRPVQMTELSAHLTADVTTEALSDGITREQLLAEIARDEAFLAGGAVLALPAGPLDTRESESQDITQG